MRPCLQPRRDRPILPRDLHIFYASHVFPLQVTMAEYWKSTVSYFIILYYAQYTNIISAKILVQVLFHIRKGHQVREATT